MRVNGMYAIGRLKTGTINGTEADYGGHLEELTASGEVLWYAFEGMTLKLEDGCRYTPDFAVFLTDGQLQMHEVKGYWQDDAKAKSRWRHRFFQWPSSRSIKTEARGRQLVV